MTQYDYVNWLDDIINYYESNDVDIDRSFLIRIIERMADSANVSFDEMIDILSQSEANEEFREEDHPRDSDGKFTSKGSGSSVVLEDEIKEHIPKGDVVGSTTIRDPKDSSKKYDIEWGDMEDDRDAIDDFRDDNDLWRELELNPDNNRDQEMTVEGEMLEDAMKQWGETNYPDGSVYLTRDGTWVGGKSIYGYDEDHRPQIRKGLTYAGIKIEHTERTAYSDSSDLTDGLNISGMIRARASPNEGLNLDISHPITSSQRRAIQNFMIENDLSQFDLVVDLGNKMKDGNEDTILRSFSYESYSKEEFREDDHPRDENGKFTLKGSRSNKDNINNNKIKYDVTTDKTGRFETGKPVTFDYVHNKEKSPYLGSRFGQDIEPHGKYILEKTKGSDYERFPERWETGTITFKNPLVIKIENTVQWKKDLVKATGKKGKKLTDFLIDEGYDGIVTVYEDGNTSEIIRLFKKQNSNENFKEDDHPRDSDGKFTDKDGGSDDEPKDVKSYKADTLKKVEPKKEIKEKQDKINKTVTDKVEEAIKELGIEDKIYDVAMQGSYEKGTDLPSSGSDMDLFVVFKTDVPQEERDSLGLEIGRKVLNKDFAESQGWTDYYDEEVTATSKYVQAFFKDGKQDVEVQIVPTRHLTLEQIKEKKLNGEDIDIGMERTPHQTEYMKEALKGKEGEVRVLKKFMKEAGLYGSNLKEMGFSGYSAEVLIDQFGSFENVIDFFADLKEGDIVDKQGGGKRNKENAFSMIDPIDPNRDLVSAFSTQKIGKTINVAKYFKETGKIPKTKYREMDSATITFDSDEVNEDKLTGQVRRLAKSYQEQLGKMGFEINTKEETINGIKVEVPDFSFDSEWDDDKKKTTVKINFGTNTKTIPKEYKDKGVDLDRERAIDGYKKANSGLKFVEEDGKLKAIKERQFTDIADAIKYLMNTEGKIVKSNQNEFIKNNGRTSIGKSKFEEI